MQVRLITSPDEPYIWRYMEKSAHLFQKHLSKHTMGACVELYNKVGETFEAIKAPGAPDCPTEGDVSFTSTIKQFERKNALLQQDHIRVVEACERWQAQAKENGQLRASAESELAVKQAELESAQSVVQELRRQLQAVSESLEGMQRQRANYVQDMNEISRIVDNVRSGLCTVAEPVTM